MDLFPSIIIVIKTTIADRTNVLEEKFSHGFVLQHDPYLNFLS
jgi:hypothetical protein